MSEYLYNVDFDALMASAQEPFDFNPLDYSAPIGQSEAPDFDYNATYGFDSGMDFDFNADFGLNPSLPLLPNAAAMTDQSCDCKAPDLKVLLDNDAGPSSPSNPGLSVAPTTPKNGMGNGQLVCAVCHQSFYTLGRLEKHDDTNEIRICSHSGCDSRFRSCRRLRGHLTTPHLPGHHAVWDDSAITCAECNGTFDDESKLRGHAKRENHSCYACSCGVSFARNDVLIRHLNGFTKNGAKYQCTFCRRHRGKQAFSRRDHLVQHLRGYHKMEPEEVKDVVPPSRESIQSLLPLTCPHADCEAYRDDAFKTLSWKDQTEKRPFQKQADYNKHMREIHKESAFSCSVAGCERVGVKGYMREKDLMKHFADKHPEAPSYSYVPPKPRKYRCAGCGLELNSLQALQYHEAAICPARRTIYASNLPITTTS